MFYLSLWTRGVVLVTLSQCLLLGQAQELEIECVNGELMDGNDTCQCYPGWAGENCSTCRGRMRLTNSSGIISDDSLNMNYGENMQCFFYVEMDQLVKSVHLKLHFLHLECQWDYLTVFDGDSISAPKLATYTGDIIELETENDTVGTILNPQHELSSSGPILLYFYSDQGSHGPGFELAYWLDYECPDFCSERGVCDSTTGTCTCDPDWTGDACHVPICPNNCSGNGTCDTSLDKCVCNQGYQGEDCSVEEALAHWTEVPYDSSSLISLSIIGRASSAEVMWGDSILVYGGYRFPEDGLLYYQDDGSGRGAESGSGSGAESGSGSGAGSRAEFSGMTESSSGMESGDVYDDLLRYTFSSGVWEVLNTSAATEPGRSDEKIPSSRYGHSAVVYNGCMYVFGGSLYPSETITSELWRLNLTTFQWTLLFADPANSSLTALPLAVRGHTAHVVGSKMVILFGISPGEEEFPAYVQEYDIVTGEWSLAPPDNGMEGRTGHTSVYSQDTQLVYVYGGRNSHNNYLSQLNSYDPICRVWTTLPDSGSGRYLHSSVLLGPLLVSFAGCKGDGSRQDCFSHDLLLYNTLCRTWQTVEVPGLPANASRYGSASLVDPRDGGSVVVFGGFVGTIRSDMLRLVAGDCGQWGEESDCVNASGLMCAWRREEAVCVSVGELQGYTNVSFMQCAVDNLPAQPTCPPSPSIPYHCSSYSSCQTCVLYGCHWGLVNQTCFSNADIADDPNITVADFCAENSCYSQTSCDTCTTGDCLWCPSLSQCIPGSNLYGVAYPYGQCLGWVRSCTQLDCEERGNCTSCQELPQCGWCNDPSDTGKGQCSLGGFRGPRNENLCQSIDSVGNQEEWEFSQCSACQCNGHSTCANNSSVCQQCVDDTTGNHCESCSPGFYGTSLNGGKCDVCDCNGYNFECDVLSGDCECLSMGVTGSRCTNCSELGDADNFCYTSLEVGFIYTFSVNAPNEVQGFYVVTPPKDQTLHFKFDMTENIVGLPVTVQLFLGRLSENLWALVNLTDVVLLGPLGSYDRRYGSFSSNDNISNAMLTTFAHMSLYDSENFSLLLEEAVESRYTRHMWNGDVSLVLHVSNLRFPSTFKITVDQQDYYYLLYFFATFIICFSVLLSAFLLVWYIKKKLVFRAYMRQQYIELQRRVARPFTKVMVEVDNAPVNSRPLPVDQNPSYLGVEACRDDKAAVLSLLVKMPGDHKTGRASLGRTGLCLGSSLVYINSSKKPKQKKKAPAQGGGQRREGSGQGGAVRQRREGQNGTAQRELEESSSENSALVPQTVSIRGAHHHTRDTSSHVV